MLPARSVVQVSKTLNPDDEKVFSTYQDEYTNIRNHGDLVHHYGNNAYLTKESYNYSHPNLKPFLSPFYHNLTSKYFIFNRSSDGYSNNYRSSDDNPLRRPLSSAPIRTKLAHLYKYKVAPIAQPDQVAIYQDEFLNQRVNDHFFSQKPLKTETVNLRDTIACLMELADFMRNKSYDTNSRKQFEELPNGLNQFDICGQLFSKLIINSENLLLSYNKLNVNAVELKKIYENFRIPENLIDKNIWDRRLRPNFERSDFMDTENSIKSERKLLNNYKDQAFLKLKEVETLLNSIENYVHKDLVETIHKAKILIMFKLNKINYEKIYLRDSNGYIKNDAKIPIPIENWFVLADNTIRKSIELEKKSDNLNQTVIVLINELGVVLSQKFLETHQISTNQVEDALKTQSNLVRAHNELNEEIIGLNQSINDTKLKKRNTEMLNEVLLTQLSVPISEIDENYEKNRKRQSYISNNVWSNANNLRYNLKNMLEYRNELRDKSERLNKTINSNKAGIDYDINNIIGPRRHGVATHPSAKFVSKSLHNFHFI